MCLSVSLSVKSHLTFGASVCPEIAATDSAGNVGRKFVRFSLKPLHSRAMAIPALYGYREVGHFLSGNMCMSLPSYDDTNSFSGLSE